MESWRGLQRGELLLAKLTSSSGIASTVFKGVRPKRGTDDDMRADSETGAAARWPGLQRLRAFKRAVVAGTMPWEATSRDWISGT
jgi:hypothetical protein